MHAGRGASIIGLVLGGLLEGWHPVILLVIALIVFGPGKLPEVFGQIGRGVREFREQMDSTSTSAIAAPDDTKKK